MESRSGGEHLYCSLLDIMRAFEDKYPQVVDLGDTSSGIPFLPSHSQSGCWVCGLFPLEVLDIIFLLSKRSDLVRLRRVSKDWCFASSCYTHASVRFRLRPDWQSYMPTPKGMKDAAVYSFVAEVAFLCCTCQWHFRPWVYEVTSENWVSSPAPFYFHTLLGVRSVRIVGVRCCLRNFPVVVYPYTLPPDIRSLTLSRCSLWGHSIETMLILCERIEMVHVLSVYHGHLVGVFRFATLACILYAEFFGV